MEQITIRPDSGDIDTINAMIQEKIAELYPDEGSRPVIIITGCGMGFGERIAGLLALTGDMIRPLSSVYKEDMLLRELDLAVPQMREIKFERTLRDMDYYKEPYIELFGKQAGGAIWREQEHLHQDPAHGRQYVRKHKKQNRKR